MAVRLVISVLLSVVFACAGDPSDVRRIEVGGGTGSIVLALSAGGADSALLGDEVVAFRIRMFETPAKAAENDAYFVSDCVAYNTFFELSNLPVGRRWVIVYEGFSATDCASTALAAVGVRGEIRVAEQTSADSFYYIQVNRKGGFTSFPLPGPDLNPVQGGTTCAGQDDVCRTALGHPSARCDSPTSGICRVESLFPLNTRARRAFHSAVPAGGRVMLFGGYNFADAKQLQVQQPGAEAFDGSTALFSSPTLSAIEDEHAAGLSVAWDGGRKVVLFGGASTVAIEESLPDFLPVTCTGADKCTMTLSNLANVLDVAGGRIVASSLPFSGALGVAAVVGSPDGASRILVRPGLVQKATSQVELGKGAWLCAVDEADGVACQAVTGADVGRGLPAGVCLAESAGVCQEYLIVGGGSSGPGGQDFAEVYVASTGTIKKLAAGTGLPEALVGAVAFRAGGGTFTLGGMTHEAKVGAGPLRLDVDPATGRISATQVQLQGDVKETLRVFHQVTPLSDGTSVLVTGGIGADLEPLDTALVLAAADGALKVVGRPRLATPRLGHAATLIGSGLLKGAVLVTGGLSRLSPSIGFAEGAEIFIP